MTDTVNRMPVLFAAQAVAMSARTDGLTAHAVEDLRVKAEELLPKGDGLRLAVLSFATQYEAWRRDLHALRRFGEALERDIQTALNPDRQPVRERRDIDG